VPAIATVRYGRYHDCSGLAIRGTFNAEVINILEGLGCKVEKLSVVERTIGRFCKEHIDATFLVRVTDHFLVVHKGVMSDSQPRPNRKVIDAWRVDAPAKPHYKPQVPKPPRPPKAKPDINQVRP
jgi:hypothetical protein